jgi:hypothetical protein
MPDKARCATCGRMIEMRRGWRRTGEGVSHIECPSTKEPPRKAQGKKRSGGDGGKAPAGS